MKYIVVGVSVALLISVFSINSCAQATAQITGTVKDQSGAVLPGVGVSAIQTDTGIMRSTVSNESGFFVLPDLLVGPYRLEAALPGFRTYIQTGIVLQVNASVVLNVTLAVGQVTEQVEVQANAALVETRTSGVGQVIENQRILELPLNGRQVTQLLTLAGASVQSSSQAGQAAGSPGYAMQTGVWVSVAGGTPYGVQYSLDGATHINTWDGTSMPLPFPDALQEFRMVTSAQDASNGMRGGASVNAVVKSGTNAFHGDLFEFVRNNSFNARDFFATKNDGLKRNQFGGTIGGPFRKDRLFFFGGYQGTTIRQFPTDTTVFVPTPQMLAGDFTTFTSPACQGGRQVSLSGPFVNNRIDPSMFSAAAVRVSARLPKALDGCGRFIYGNPLHENQFQIPLRVDYQLNSKQTVFGRYMVTRIARTTPYDLTPDDVLTTGIGLGRDDIAHSLIFGDTYLVSPNVVNAFRLSGTYMDSNALGANFFSPAEVGINTYSYIPKAVGMSVSGGFAVGTSSSGVGQTNQFSHETLFGVNDDVSVVRGSHQFAFGGHAIRNLLNNVANTWGIASFQFNGQLTGAGMADFLLGSVGFFRQANPDPENLTQNFYGLYAQDTWKVTPKLTLNYGLRWEPFIPMSFKHGDLYNFSLDGFFAGKRSTVIPNAPPGFTYPGDPGFNGKSGISAKQEVDPRLAIAWDPFGDGKTAFRLGAGIAKDFVPQIFVKNESSVSPFRLTVIRSGIGLDNPWANYPGGNPYPFFYNKQNPQFGSYGSYLPVPPNLRTMKQYSWNAGIQRQVTLGLFTSVTYIGSQMLHIWNAVELNPAQFLGTGPCTLQTTSGPVSYPTCSTSTNIDQRRLLNLINPQANLSYVTQFDDGGTQNYHGLLLDVRWRSNQNVNLSANYTWSHCEGLQLINLLNPGANYPHSAYQNNGPRNRNLDIGDCVQDRRQMFNATAVARTPAFSNQMVRRLASDWSFSTIFQARSGSPLNIVIGTDVALNGFNGTERPNQVLANPYGSRSSLTNYFNPSAFATPATGTYGNTGFNSVVGPAFWGWDQAVSREFRVAEGQRVEIRAEAFNVTNSMRPGNPGITQGSANTFGRILSSNGGPRIMQFALKYVF